KEYLETYFQVQLTKTADYMLSSVQIPATMKMPESAKDVPFIHGKLLPGGGGYQQHIWHATLARDCHVFTNCPGATHELSPVRPGFWYGNKFMPRQVQRENMLLQIFKIHEDHHIQFIHAHWPSDVFDRQKIQDNWIFGKKKTGYIALWCSNKPEFHSEILTKRELRAWGNKMAWACVCSGKTESGSYDSFILSCLRLKPKFDADELSLHLTGQEPLYYDIDGESKHNTPSTDKP
ncbi:MAG: hypothetical protein JSV03_15675, partial [Planctomycetota bacterium]